MDFIIGRRVFWFRHDFARSIHVTRTSPSVVFLLLSGPLGGGGGLSKGKIGACIAREAKCFLHLLAEWHDGGGGDWSVVVAAKAGRSANERMACLGGKRKKAGSISQMKKKEVERMAKVQKEKRT